MNKREFVQAGAGALAGIGGWTVGAGASAAPSASQSSADGSMAQWQARIGEQFSVFGATPAARLTLLQVQARTGDARTEQFSLVFGTSGSATDSAATATEGVRVLRPATGDPLALHLAPMPADGTTLLRADCCRLV